MKPAVDTGEPRGMRTGLAPQRFNFLREESSRWIWATSRSLSGRAALNLCQLGEMNMPPVTSSDASTTDVAPRLEELFRASAGAPIDWAGQSVRMAHEMTGVTRGLALRINFVRVSPVRRQALRLKPRGGRLEVDSELSRNVALWSDMAPPSIIVRFRHARGSEPMSVVIWNAWRDKDEVTHAWIGNAGMIVQEEPGGVILLKCSDGYDAPTFDDLVARLHVIPEDSLSSTKRAEE